MLKYLYFLAIVFFLISCSDESGDRSVAPMNNENVGSLITFSFNTYNGLIAEEPCSENLRGTIAHVNESNLDYICVFDDALMVWNWRMLQNSSVEPISVQSSSSNNSTALQYSSSSNYFLYSAVESAYSSITYPKSSSSGVSSSVLQNLSSSSKANWVYLNSAISYGMLEHSLDTYKTVTIGTQTWMAENMNYIGSCLPYHSEKMVTGDGCFYDYEGAKSICPKGWHLPTVAEFRKLFDFVSLTSFDATEQQRFYNYATASHKLASRRWKNNEFHGTDDYGFSAIPVGRTIQSCSFARCTLDNEGSLTFFRTNAIGSKDSSEVAYINSSQIGVISVPKSWGLSVRCVKNEE